MGNKDRRDLFILIGGTRNQVINFQVLSQEQRWEISVRRPEHAVHRSFERDGVVGVRIFLEQC